MKLISLFVLSVIVVSASAWAQAPTDPIAKALMAAPNEALGKDATVIRWNSDYTYETLKKGTSEMVCYDLSGMPGEQRWPFSVECTSHAANLDRVAQNRRINAEAGGDEKKVEAMIQAGAKNGTRVKAVNGSVFFNFRGPDPARANRHTTVAMPGATSQTTGLPDTRESGGAWVMFAGTSEAHIMVPGR